MFVGATVLFAGAGILALDAAPAATAAPSPDQVAMATLDNIVQGNDAAAVAPFDATMQPLLSAPALGQAWKTYQEQFGAYQSHGAPEDIQRGDLTVVNVPLQMARQPGEFRITVHPDGTVAGLYFLNEGVPVP
jgi:hypothetical protein